MIRWTARAIKDVMATEEYIARDAPRTAAAWVARIRARARRAAASPKAGRIVPEFGRSDVREVFVKNYRIVYRVEARGISVLTVFESHRQLRDITE